MKKLLIFLSFFSISIIKSASISEHFAPDGGKVEKENNELSEKEYTEKNNTILTCFEDKDIKPSDLEKLLTIINQYDNKSSSLIWDSKEDEGSLIDPETKKFLDLKHKHLNSFEYLSKALSKKKIPMECIEDIFSYSSNRFFKYDQTLKNIYYLKKTNKIPILKLINGNIVSCFGESLTLWTKNNLKYDSTRIGTHSSNITSIIEMTNGELITASEFGGIGIWREIGPNNWIGGQGLAGLNNNQLIKIQENEFASFSSEIVDIYQKDEESGDYMAFQSLNLEGKCISLFKIQNDLISFIIKNGKCFIKILRRNNINRWEVCQTINVDNDTAQCPIKLNDDSFIYYANEEIIIYKKNNGIWEKFQSILLMSMSLTPFYRFIELRNNDLVVYNDNNSLMCNIIIFRKNKSNKYQYFQTLKGHADSIWCVIQLSNGNVASSSADGKIKIWQCKKISNKYDCIQTFDAGYGFAKSIEERIMLSEIETDTLAITQTDNRLIKIWNMNDVIDIKTKQKNLIVRLCQYLKNHSDARMLLLTISFIGLVLKKPELLNSLMFRFTCFIFSLIMKNTNKFFYYINQFYNHCKKDPRIKYITLYFIGVWIFDKNRTKLKDFLLSKLSIEYLQSKFTLI